MRRVKKSLALMLAAVMLCSTALTGCGSKENDKKTDAAVNDAGGTEADKSAEADGEAQAGDTGFDIGEVEEFTIFWPEVKPDHDNWESLVAQKITEKTGVKLKFIFPVGDYQQQLSMLLAGGDYPDLICTKEDALTTLVQANAVIDLEPYIDKYGPNIKDFWGEDLYPRLRYSKENPAIYSFGTGERYSDPAPGINWNNGFFLQNAVLKELGYPEIKTLQQFEDALVAYKEKNPKIDGQDTIGLTLVTADGWRYLISLTNPAYYTAGQPDNGEWSVDEAAGTVKMHYRTGQDKEYFKWLNHLVDIGILDPESFTQTYDEYIAKVSSGRVLGLIDGYWEFSQGIEALKASEKFERLYMGFPVTQKEGMVYPTNWSDGKCRQGGIVITDNCKNPEKIVNFFNYLASEEGQVLREWGVEGVNWNWEEGQRVRNPEDVARDMEDSTKYISESGVKCYRVLYWLLWGNGAVLSDGTPLNSENAEVTIATFSDAEKETLAAYGQSEFTGIFPASTEFPVRKYGSMASYSPLTEETQVAWTKCQSYILPDIAAAILAKPADFDAKWDEFMDHLKKAGIEQVEAEVTQVYQDRLEMWK